MNKMMKNLVIFLIVAIFAASIEVNAQVPGAIVNPSASMVRPSNPNAMKNNNRGSASASKSGVSRGSESIPVSGLNKGKTMDSTLSYSADSVPMNNNQMNNNQAMMMNTDSGIPVDNKQFVYDNNQHMSNVVPQQENFNQQQPQYTIPQSNNQQQSSNSNDEYSNNTAFGAGALSGLMVMGAAVFLTRKASDDTNNKASLKKTPTAARNIRNNRLSTPLMATDGEGETTMDSTMDNLEKIGAEEPKMDTEVEDVPVKPKQPRAASWFPGKTAPAHLDGTFAGDVGFDPLGFGENDIKAMRDAEMKHGRIAMLAAAGWPLSELWHKTLADTLHLNNMLGENGMTPSILNGFGSSPAFLAGAYLMAAGIGSFFELQDKKPNPDNPADKGFDPWGLKNMRSDSGLYKTDKEGQFAMELAEVKHGRLAMLAITSFVFQELITKVPVVQETPQFF